MLYPLELLRFIEARDKYHLVDCSSHYVGDVRELIMSRNMLYGNGLGNDVGTEVMKSNRKMLRARSSARIGSKSNATLVVFKNSAV